MNNIEKIQIINDRINNLTSIIDNLSYGISNIPWEESKGIDTRQSNLNDYRLQKEALELEKQALTNQG